MKACGGVKSENIKYSLASCLRLYPCVVEPNQAEGHNKYKMQRSGSPVGGVRWKEMRWGTKEVSQAVESVLCLKLESGCNLLFYRPLLYIMYIIHNSL